MPRRLQEMLKMDEGFGEIGARAELGFFYGVRHAHELALPRGGLDVVRHVVVENDDAGRVALLVGEISERNRAGSGRNRAW